MRDAFFLQKAPDLRIVDFAKAVMNPPDSGHRPWESPACMSDISRSARQCEKVRKSQQKSYPLRETLVRSRDNDTGLHVYSVQTR